MVDLLGTIVFAIAIVHTFFAAQILKFSLRFEKGSSSEIFFHLMGEIEVVFGFWAAILMLIFAIWRGPAYVVNYQMSLQFTEPLFIFCIMIVTATNPIMRVARGFIRSISYGISKTCKISEVIADLFVILTLGPLSGSFITEPAAMTVTALLLASMIQKTEMRLMYVLLATLLVNISIGGALTPFAAPPILMVAGTWNWDFGFVLTHLGWKSLCAVFINTLIFLLMKKKEVKQNCQTLRQSQIEKQEIPLWVTMAHLLFLLFVVLAAHHVATMMSIFLLFLGLVLITQKYQEPLRLKESMLVAFFLAGIIMFGAYQRWWLEPLITNLDHTALYLGACGLTAITDNAALTYLGSQVSNLSGTAQYYLVAGAIAGGGLTLIANAPNAAGFSILQKHFVGGLNPWKLIVAALIPTAIAMLCLGYFPDL